MANIKSRLAALEAAAPTADNSAVVRIVWRGPQDDTLLAEMERRSEAEGFMLIVRKIVPHQRPAQAA
jgi:hypothetical protein